MKAAGSRSGTGKRSRRRKKGRKAALAAGEGAEGTTEIAQRASVIAQESEEVLDQVTKTKQSAETLREEIGKFQVSKAE